MGKKILIIDDAQKDREEMKAALGPQFEVLESPSAKAGLELILKGMNEISMVLLDLAMPEMDGIQLLTMLSQRKITERVCVVVVTANQTVDMERKCFSLGAKEYIRKPFDALIFKQRVLNLLTISKTQEALEAEVKKQTETVRKQYSLLEGRTDQLKEVNEKIMESLGTIVESRNLNDGEHIHHVKHITEILAKQVQKDYPEYGLTDELVSQYVNASTLHDIGKIAVPDSILLKPAKLTAEEKDVMRSHTTKGSEMMHQLHSILGSGSEADKAYEKICYDVCRSHHERYDGAGYPDGLKGDDIPLCAQIVSLADEYDSLVSERPYKNAIPRAEAFQMIIQGDLGVFNPKLLECFRKNQVQIQAVFDESQILES